MSEFIKKLKLQLLILQLQLRVLLLKQKLTLPNLDIPKKIIIHHGGGWLDFEGVNEWHKQKWGFRSSLGFYAGYTYFIEKSGKVYQARADNEEGAHAKGQNKQSIGICLEGNGEEQDFTFQQYVSLKDLINRKISEYNLTKHNLYGHNNFANTLCPSWRLTKWINDY